MSVLIKDMEMPKACLDCHFYDPFGGFLCAATRRKFGGATEFNPFCGGQPDWCPLIEIFLMEGRGMNDHLAVVVRVMKDHGEVEWTCPSLEEAYSYRQEHEKDLFPGERYDIYWGPKYEAFPYQDEHHAIYWGPKQ